MNRHRLWQLAADAVLIAVAWLLAFQLRFDSFGSIPPFYEQLVSWRTVLLVVAIKLVVFTLFGFYNRWWRYVSTRDMWGALRGVTVASPRREPRRLLLPAGGHRPAAARGRDPRLAAPARARRGLAPARADDLRAARARRASSPAARR